MLVYALVQTATSRYLSLSRASKSLGRASSLLRGSRGGFAAEHRVSKVRAAVKPAFSGLPSSVTVRRKSAAPRHLPQGEGKAASPQSTEFQRCVPQLSPPLAGCPHPSRCGAKAQHRATFPKGKARRLRRRARNLPRRGKAFPKKRFNKFSIYIGS